MTRIDELEAEIEALKDRRAAVEAEADRAHDYEIIEAAFVTSDELSNQIAVLTRELDELNDIGLMRENARDRAWHQGRTL